MANDIIIFGIILSIIFYEITEISPGGLIVPAYIAFYINTDFSYCEIYIKSYYNLWKKKICTMYHDKLYDKTHIKIFQYLYSERI